MNIVLVLHNIRSTYNVGSILRTADGLGVAKVVFSGYTPRYDDHRLLPHLREKVNRQIAKTSLGAENSVARYAEDEVATWLEEQRRQGALVFGLENNLSPQEFTRQILLGAATRMRLGEIISGHNPIVILLGEEVSGIPNDLRNHIDYFLEIPMAGAKESFNVAIATAIATWELKVVASITD